MTVVIKEERNGIYKKTICPFKRKGIRFYLFIFSLKIFRVEYEVLGNGKSRRTRIRKQNVKKTNKNKR